MTENYTGFRSKLLGRSYEMNFVKKSLMFWMNQTFLHLVLLQLLLVPVNPAKLRNGLRESLLPSTKRVYGDIPEAWYSDEAKDIQQDDLGGFKDRNRTCGDIIYLKSGEFYNFTIQPVTKLCSVVIKTEPGSTLIIPRTALSVKPCLEEHFYYIADNFQRKLVVCGDPLHVEITYAERLLLQYERRAGTGTAFTLTVTAEPDDGSGRECGYDTSRLPLPRSILVRSEAVPGQFPFLVSIFIARKGAAQPERCGGSILDKRHVLTSAHCFKDEKDIDEIYVTPGDRDTVPAGDEVARRHSVKCVELLDYRITKQGWRINDLAIAVLGSDIVFDSNLSPVCLAGPELFDGFTLAVPGYNYPAIDPVTRTVNNTLLVDPKKLEVANMFVWPNNECTRLYHHKLSTKQMCVYDHLNGTCNGQPGSPAMVKMDEKYYQVAVSSHGFPCQDSPVNRYGVFTAVTPFMRQIENKIGTLANC